MYLQWKVTLIPILVVRIARAQSQYLEDIKSGKIRHIIIGDLLAPLSKQKKTRDDFIAFFNSLIEEGVISVHTYAQHWDSKISVK
jgi:hypothetical protein